MLSPIIITPEAMLEHWHGHRRVTMLNYFTTVVGAGLILAGCASKSQPPTDGASPDPRTTALEVVNRSSSDMDIFILRGGQRIRLGLAPGNETTRFVLAPAQVAGVGTAYFQASPISGLGRPIGSEPVMLRLGDVITLNIPPP